MVAPLAGARTVSSDEALLHAYNRVLRFSHRSYSHSMSPKFCHGLFVVFVILVPCGFLSAQAAAPAASPTAKPALATLKTKLERIREPFPGEMSIYMKNLS